MISVLKKKVASSLVIILFILTVLPSSVLAEEVVTDESLIVQTEDEELNTDIDSTEPEDIIGENNSIGEMDSEDGGQSEEPIADKEQPEEPVEDGEQQASSALASQGLVNYVGVIMPYLQAPEEQQIVISYGDGTENVTDPRVICEKSDGTTVEFGLSVKENELFLFNRVFGEEETGVYRLAQFIYVQDGVETSLELPEIGIEALFGVNEDYTGYQAASIGENDVSEEELEASVVTVDLNAVENAESDIEEAIEETVKIVEKEGNFAKKSGGKVSQAKDSVLSAVADVIMPAETAKAAENVVVVLDPGHGGSEPGASANGLVEKNLNLSVALACKSELEQYNGVTVYMTRSTDVTVGLKERADKAKAWGADIFVSLHMNSATASANGVEVYYPNPNYNLKVHEEGKKLAAQIQQQLVSLGLYDRHIKEDPSTVNGTYPDGSKVDGYQVIRYNKLNGIPGIIVEHAFLSNSNDAAKLRDPDFIRRLGIADATGIAKYFNLSKGISVKITNKNDFAGTARIEVSGLGNSAKIKIQNKTTGSIKEYPVPKGKGSINFSIGDFGNKRGTYILEAYNSSGNLLYNTSFYVSENTSSSIAVETDGTEKQYKVKVSFAEVPAEVTAVEVPTWTKSNQSDIIWHKATKEKDNVWQAVIDISKYRSVGDYTSHVYAKLSDGTLVGLGAAFFEVTEPSFSTEIKNVDQSAGKFDVVISDIKSPSGVNKVQVPVWCAANQSDIKWYDAVQKDGKYVVTVDMANHRYATGTYKVHVYLTAGNQVQKGVDAGEQKVILPNMDIRAENTDGKEIEYRLEVRNVNLLGVIKRVEFATWSEKNGQDDIIWYNGTKVSGNWVATANIKKHKTSGKYNVHVYATLADGTMKCLGATTFEVSASSFKPEIRNYNAEEGTFEVVVKDIKSASGVDKVQVPVWCAANQSDIKWYDAEKCDEGYKVTVSMANHRYATGRYKVHVYLTSGNQVEQGVIAGEQEVTLPNMEISASDIDGKETTYKLQVKNIGLLGVVKRVEFATWSEKGGQDDIIWYNGERGKLGEWSATADIKKHKTLGKYNVHVYVTLANGTMRCLGATGFEVHGPSISGVAVERYDEITGAFSVVVSGVQSISGVEKVEVPVWSESNQSNIKWYSAIHQSGGIYRVNVDPVNHQSKSGTYNIHVYVTMKNGVQAVVGGCTQSVTASKYEIEGESNVSVDQMVTYFKSSGFEYPTIELGAGGAPTIEKFCQLYLAEAEAEGIRAEVAFAQAMKETGWLQFGNIVKIEQFNFAGLGAEDGNGKGECASFKTVEEGIRAQIQHLKAYASKNELNNKCVDPRFGLVERGCAPYVEWLGQQENPHGKGWATSKGYGISIVSMIKALKLM